MSLMSEMEVFAQIVVQITKSIEVYLDQFTNIDIKYVSRAELDHSIAWRSPLGKLRDISFQLQLLSKKLNAFGFDKILRENAIDYNGFGHCSNLSKNGDGPSHYDFGDELAQLGDAAVEGDPSTSIKDENSPVFLHDGRDLPQAPSCEHVANVVHTNDFKLFGDDLDDVMVPVVKQDHDESVPIDFTDPNHASIAGKTPQIESDVPKSDVSSPNKVDADDVNLNSEIQKRKKKWITTERPRKLKKAKNGIDGVKSRDASLEGKKNLIGECKKWGQKSGTPQNRIVTATLTDLELAQITVTTTSLVKAGIEPDSPLKCIEWCARHCLIANEKDCPTCLAPMHFKCRSERKDGYIWRCPVRLCRKRVSLRDGSFFSKSHLPLWKIVRFIHIWTQDTLINVKMHELDELDISKPTAIEWSNFLRDICPNYVRNWQAPVGHDAQGQQKIIENDESIFFKIKYNRGRRRKCHEIEKGKRKGCPDSSLVPSIPHEHFSFPLGRSKHQRLLCNICGKSYVRLDKFQIHLRKGHAQPKDTALSSSASVSACESTVSADCTPTTATTAAASSAASGPYNDLVNDDTSGLVYSAVNPMDCLSSPKPSPPTFAAKTSTAANAANSVVDPMQLGVTEAAMTGATATADTSSIQTSESTLTNSSNVVKSRSHIQTCVGFRRLHKGPPHDSKGRTLREQR